MTEHPYRTAETPPEQLMLERVREIFESTKGTFEGKYVATQDHGIGTLTMMKERSGQDGEKEETVIYTLNVGSPEKGLTVRILDRLSGTQVQGFRGYEGANKKLGLRTAQEILGEIQTRQELQPNHAKTIGNNPTNRAGLIRKIQKHGYTATHGITANVTCDGITSVEKYAPKNSPETITVEIELEEQKKRLRFRINHEGEIIAVETEKTEGLNRKMTTDIHRIRGGFSNRKELKPDSKDFSEAVHLLDRNLETFQFLEHDEETAKDDPLHTRHEWVRNSVRKL